MTTSNEPNSEICANCKRPTTKHRPWCKDVQTSGPPNVGDTVDDSILGAVQLISVYSRRQAIDDGVLVDCTQDPFDELNRNAGLKVDVCMTSAAFERYVEVPTGYKGSQNINGRYWDIVWMFGFAARRNRNGSELLFEFVCIPNGTGYWSNEREGEADEQRMVKLKAVAGSGDRGEPCVTFMLPWED